MYFTTIKSILFFFTGTRFERLLMKIGYQAKNASTELKIRCLDALSTLFYLPVSGLGN